MNRIIFHVDVNSAYLSWEACYRLHHLGAALDLRTVASAVCGDMSLRRGIVLAKSTPAKSYGIQSGMTVPEARKRCPELVMVPPNYSLYETCSGAFLALLREYTPDVEVYSIDEAFMDMTSSVGLFGTPKDTADLIRRRIREELGFTVNIGISDCKVLAKMAGELKKPDLTHTLFPNEIQKKLWCLPVSELFFAGPASVRTLTKLGIHTIGELARTDPSLLKLHLKKHGEILWAFANGIDFASVEATPPPQKGYGNSTTLPFDAKDASTARLVLLALAETVAARLRAAGMRAELISIGIRDNDFHSSSRQMRLPAATNITLELYHHACLLFDSLWDKKSPVRHLAIHTGRLSDGSGMRQIDLFDTTDYVRLEKLDKMVDDVRRRYGIDALKRASFLTSPIDHMEGGVSREKRTVDYKKLVIL